MPSPSSSSNSATAPAPSLAGLRVLSLESRRSQEMGKLIANYGGEATVAPSMQEVPLASQTKALAFVNALIAGDFDIVIFLTGVGTRMLARLAESADSRDKFVAALGRISVVARGPKPVAALKELGVPVTLAVPEPNTWKDVLHALDQASATLPLPGRRVAVQEYGSTNTELLAGLTERGATVVGIPVYEWSLPDDLAPLRAAVQAVAENRIDIALFTTSVQVIHLFRVATEMNMAAAVRAAFSKIAVGSIGPVTSEALREHSLPVDFEPEHPKMGFLVNEAARRGAQLVAEKRRDAQQGAR